MRTVITPLNSNEKQLVESMAHESKLSEQVDIVEDIYGFMKEPKFIDEGDLTEDLIKDFCKGKFEWYLPTKKKVQGRISFFNQLLNHPYYSKFKELPTDKSSAILLQMLNAFYEDKKEKEKQGSNPDQEKDEAMREFEDIIRYGMELFDLLDDEWFKSLMQSQIPETGGDGCKPESMPKVVQKIVKEMKKELQIFELSQKLEFTIRLSKKGKFNEVQFPDDGLDVAKMVKFSDITKLLPAQLALDEELFMVKLVNKDLLKKKYMQRQEKRQILYMVVDSSGSMGDRVIGDLTKFDVSKAVIIALMKKIIDNEDLFYFRYFDDKIFNLHKIATKAEALKFLPDMVYGQMSGGGTNIQHALVTAANDIHKKVGDKMDKADILLISDGLCDVVVDECNKALDGIDMHTVLITTEKKEKDNQYQSKLIQMSKNFLMTKCDKHTEIIELANILTK